MYRFHRQGDRRMERFEAEVYWTPCYPSYLSAGDEAEPYCSRCDEELEEGWHYCPSCGNKLVIVREINGIHYKEHGW